MTLVTQDDLMAWSGYSTRAALERFLKENNIPYYYGKGGKICTTAEAINRPLVDPGRPQQQDRVEFA